MAEGRLIRRYLVGGMVQGVGFRYYVRRAAQRLGLSGWVRNLPDGRVESVASGEPIQLAAFEHELRRGPSMANVTSLQAFVVSDQPEVLTGFEIRG